MPQPVAIDTAKATDELVAAGLDNKSARAVVAVINESVTSTAATAGDLRETESRLKAVIVEKTNALEKKVDKQGAALEKRIDRQDVKFAEIRTEIAEQRAEIVERFAAQDVKIAEVKTEIAEVRTEISDSTNRMVRSLAIYLGIALALAAVWSTFVPAIRMSLAGAP